MVSTRRVFVANARKRTNTPCVSHTMEHFYDALTEGKADAALAASLFHYKELEINDLKHYLDGKGVPVRL